MLEFLECSGTDLNGALLLFLPLANSAHESQMKLLSLPYNDIDAMDPLDFGFTSKTAVSKTNITIFPNR